MTKKEPKNKQGVQFYTPKTYIVASAIKRFLNFKMNRGLLKGIPMWAFIVLTCIGLVFGYSKFHEWRYGPRDLGKDIVYVGKVNEGCNWIEATFFFGFCSSGVNNFTYYFETDLNEAELKEYFEGASVEFPEGEWASAARSSQPIKITSSSNSGITAGGMMYYNSVDNLTGKARDLKTNKKYLIRFSSDEYEKARSVLK